MGVRHELPKNWWFLPNGDFMISWCIGSRVDLISPRGNHFYNFCSLSSLITLLCQHFAYVASHLMRIETIVSALTNYDCKQKAHVQSRTPWSIHTRDMLPCCLSSACYAWERRSWDMRPRAVKRPSTARFHDNLAPANAIFSDTIISQVFLKWQRSKDS